MYDEERLKKIETLLVQHDKLLSGVVGQDEAYKRYMRDLMSNLNEDNVPGLNLKVSNDQMTTAITAAIGTSGAQISLLAAYTGMAVVVEVTQIPASPDYTKTYKIGTAYYRYNGTAWVNDTSITSAYMTIAAINGQSAVKIKADKLDIASDYVTFTGLAGTTEIVNGAAIITNTVSTRALAAVDSGDYIDYICLKNGIDLSNSAYMDFDNADSEGYKPDWRRIKGLYKADFYGDLKLTAGGVGMMGNNKTALMGSLRVKQSTVGTSPDYDITQYGMELFAGYDMNIAAGYQSNSKTNIYSRYPGVCTTGTTIYTLEVSSSGIIARKGTIASNGTITPVSSTTLYS